MLLISIRAGLVLAAVALVITGCGRAPESTTPPAGTVTTAAAAAPSPMTPPVSINALMVGFIDHAGHALWDVERAGAAPKSDAQWADVEHHAIQLAAAGSLVALGGTGVHDRTYADRPGWQKWSRDLSSAGAAALTAARQRNMTALVAANGQLVEACQNCHEEFKPDLPSEGITHSHGH